MEVSSDSLASIIVHGKEASATIRGCKIHSGNLNGVLVEEGAKLTLEDSDVYGNQYTGVRVDHGSSAVIRRCKLRDGVQNGALFLAGGTGTVEDCDIFGNKGCGVEIREGGDALIRSCKIHDQIIHGVYTTGNTLGAWQLDAPVKTQRTNNAE